jgi:succinoglycan biosynthesis transport protein ExoP
MSIIQFLRILWAWRWITVLATFSCIAGALLVILVVPPRWEAHTRIMLDVVKPDPLTGQAIGPNASAYAGTQAELIKDYTVAGKAVDQLGWLSDPATIEAYQRRPKKDVRDFRRWVAQQVIDRTDAGLVPGTNILDITYTAPTANEAKAVADALTKAFIDSSVEFRRQEASRNADWFEAQTRKAKADLDAASDAETAYQRQTGVILQDEKTDVDSARLHALASDAAAGAPVFAPITTSGSAAGAELAQLDAAISQASQSLGPNHPELQALKLKRAALASEVAQEKEAARAASSTASAGVGALDRAVASAKSKVLGQSAELEHLRQLQAEVDLRRDQYSKTAGRAAELRQEAMIGDTGLTVLGPAAAPQKPKFPNKPLILGGSLGLGVASGILAGLLLELLGRRVRGLEDLKSIDAPVLSVVPATTKRRLRDRSRIRLGSYIPRRLRPRGVEA